MKNLTDPYMEEGVGKNCQTHAYVINEWPLIMKFNPGTEVSTVDRASIFGFFGVLPFSKFYRTLSPPSQTSFPSVISFLFHCICMPFEVKKMYYQILVFKFVLG